MAKVCTCGCNGPVFSKGLCQREWKRQYGKPLKKTAITKKPNNNSKNMRKRTPRKISENHASKLREYWVLRDKFLEENKECKIELPGCTKLSTDVHHTRGRGIWLLVVEFFLPSCRKCHDWVTEHSKEAIEMGLSERRNTPIDRPQYKT